MPRTTLVLVLMLTSVPMARADPVTLTVSGTLVSAVAGDADVHLGFPVFPGERFVFSVNLQSASSDLDPNPNSSLFNLNPNQLRFVFAPDSFASEFTSRFTDTSTALVVNGEPFDTVRFDMFAQTAPQFEFSLVFSGPASWLNSDMWAVSQLTTPLPLDASLSATSVGDGSTFMQGRIENITLSPPPVPEPANVLLIGTGLLAMGAQRWRWRRATTPRD